MMLLGDQAAHHRHQVERYLRDTSTLMHQRQKNAWFYILQVEITNGTQFMCGTDGVLYVYLGLIEEIVALPKQGRGGDRVWAYMDQAYGLGETDATAKLVYARMRSYAITHGSPGRPAPVRGVQEHRVYGIPLELRWPDVARRRRHPDVDQER